MAPSNDHRETLAASTGGANISFAPQTPHVSEESHAQGSGELAHGPTSSNANKKKKRKHRGGRGKRLRRQSFAAPPNIGDTDAAAQEVPDLLGGHPEELVARSSFYRLHQGNRSNASINSEALLDHRDSGPLQTRRQSIHQNVFGPHGGVLPPRSQSHQIFQPSSFLRPLQNKSRLSRTQRISDSERDEDEEDEADDRTPLISSANRYSYAGERERESHTRRSSRSTSTRRSRPLLGIERSATSLPLDYDVNNPPSVPGTPTLGADMGYDDAMLTGEMPGRTLENEPSARPASHDALIDIDEDTAGEPYVGSVQGSRKASPQRGRRLNLAEDDVCFPHDGLSEMGHEDYMQRRGSPENQYRQRRRRLRLWPELSILEEWSREEKEQMSMEEVRTLKVSEPLMIGGRLRPQKRVWHRVDEDIPYRFTYFNDELQSTIHSQTISELLQPGQTFKDLFIPDPPLLSDDSSDEEEDEVASKVGGNMSSNGLTRTSTRQSSRIDPKQIGDSKQIRSPVRSPILSGAHTSPNTPVQAQFPNTKLKPPRYGPRPVFWLDVLSPTDAEMRVISKAFGIHPLTAEDIMTQEAREKVELFRHYYFVNYRSFEQDTHSEDYMEPVNMYVVVFRDGVISFHFSLTPHPANVRRRIRQLSDYLIPSADWISYAIIDDITDVYAPLIQRIEDEVDEIDDHILRLHTADNKVDDKAKASNYTLEKGGEVETSSGETGADMLRRVGECRKKVMSLYRLLGTKADVIKGFAKRCNEQWEVAPRSEIGLYLGDIQDHIVTMTSNLSHYENLLSRAHSNYLAQLNILMNERQERTADVLGKLTVLSTIVLPMNLVTGMFGANFRVPGDQEDSLWWFWGTTGFLFIFGLVSFLVAKRVYGLV